jgi:hypothetical protein
VSVVLKILTHDGSSKHIVTDLINALRGNNTVNTNIRNNRMETVFYAVRTGRAHGAIGILLPAKEAVNMHPQQWETVFP